MTVRLIRGDCVEVMRELEVESVDAIVCDPPYGLEFMGKAWDRLDLWRTDETRERTTGRQSTSPLSGKPRHGLDTKAMQEWHESWATEAYRVLKPGVCYELLVFDEIVQSCSCEAAQFGDPCCKHKAAFYLKIGVLTVPETEAA